MFFIRINRIIIQHKLFIINDIYLNDPWWDAHYPPCGWGCRCRITPVSAAEFEGKPAPDNGDYTVKDKFGTVHSVPKGVDLGFGYTPGRSNGALLNQAVQKADGWDSRLARANVGALVNSPVFERFFKGALPGEFPLAVLSKDDQALLGAVGQTVLLSRDSIADHVASHPDIGIEDYRKAQAIIDQGDLYQKGDDKLIYQSVDGVPYRAVLKRTQAGDKNYFLALFKNSSGKPPADAVKVR